ncbi:MAG: hypothetical protein IJU39_07155 [Clostridia bacterium]|nr:hypothetical protein [Clostridia bacterium]
MCYAHDAAFGNDVCLRAHKVQIASDAHSEVTDTIHELGHFVSAWSNEKYQDVSSAIFNWYIDKFGYADYADAIDHFKTREGLNYSDAVEEFTNECIAGLFAKEGGAEDFVEWLQDESGYTKAEQKTILQKLIDLINDIIDSIKTVIRTGKLSATAQKAVQMEMDKAQDIRKMFLEAIDEASKNTNKKTATDGGVKYSIQEIVDENGKSYGIGVYLDSNLLDNLTEKERKQIIVERVKELGGQSFTAYDDNGTEVEIRIADKNERFVNSKGKAVYVNKDLATKNINNPIKQETVALADEVIEASKHYSEEAARYPHGWLDNNGKNKWEYRTIYLQEKNNAIWRATLNIANTVNGEKVLYDINKIEKVRQSVESDTVPHSSVGQSVKSDTVPYDNSISQNSKNVNTENVKNSLKDDEYLKLAENPEENKGIELDELKIASSYGEDNAQRLIDNSDIRYIDKNKKRIEKWEKRTRLQLPVISSRFDSVNSISQNSENVNNRNEKFSMKDEEYLKLAENPEENKEKLQKMVDEAAREAMPNSEIVDENGNLLATYHGTSEDFTVFDKKKGRANMDIQGMFFTPWKFDAGGYGEKVGKYYLNSVNPVSEGVGYKVLNKFKGQNNAGIKAREYLESLGYDGVNNGNEEYIAFNSNQIKSADPVTYDNDGNVIPLSERFNEEEVDIRYSIKSDKPYNDYSKALTGSEWKKYNNAMITGVDAGLRINDHSMLVECEKGDYSYKLVIYDNTFEEKPIQAVYGIGNDDYSDTTIHEMARMLSDLEDNDYGRSFIAKALKTFSQMYEIVLGKYSGQTSRYTKFRTGSIGSRANTQEQSYRGTVPQGTEKNGSYSRKDITDVDAESIVDTSSPRYILSEALKGTTLNAAERENIEKYQQNAQELDRQETAFQIIQ